MSDDLVKRLRNGPTTDSCDAFDLVHEAADEIERLRALFVLDDKQHSQHIKSLTETHATRVKKYADALAAAQARIAALEGALRDVLDRFTTAFPACEDYPPIQAARAALAGEK